MEDQSGCDIAEQKEHQDDERHPERMKQKRKRNTYRGPLDRHCGDWTNHENWLEDVDEHDLAQKATAQPTTDQPVDCRLCWCLQRHAGRSQIQNDGEQRPNWNQ